MGRVDGVVGGGGWVEVQVRVGGLTWKRLSNQDCVYSGYSIRCNLCGTSSTQ